MLLDHGADTSAPGSNGRTLLHAAAASGDIPMVEYLLTKNIELPSDILLTAMNARPHRPKIVRLLMDHGAAVDVYDSNGRTPLHVAVTRGYLPSAEDLL
ncbi:hypothetical protein HYDPIDRAFT_163196, partial [Hydnomerulius pinastri MD-312]